MCFLCKQTHTKSVCVKCRSVNMPCNHEKIVLGYTWRPPKKNNDKAWKKIEDGEYLWDKKAIIHKESKSRIRHAHYVLYWTKERMAERKERIRLRREQEQERLRNLAESEGWL